MGFRGARMPGENILRQRLEAARKDLLELTTRSRLLDTPRHRTRSRTLEVVDEVSEETFRLLVRERKSMTFQAAAKPRAPDPAPPPAGDAGMFEELVLTPLAQPEEDALDEKGVPRKHVDSKLQTTLSSDALQKRLLSLYYDARTFEEEQGVNILYLALGFLRWTETEASDRERHAPLLLVPVTLERQSASTRFRISWTEEELSTNLSLQAKLRLEYGVDLPDVPDLEDLSPVAYFEQVASAVKSLPRWEVLPDDIVLSFFSFSKFLMYRDLDPENWSAEENSPLSTLLLERGFESVPPICAPGERIDPLIPPKDAVHIMDADSSQALAIEEVRRGRSLVIQGPPGTGKSQTIANLIAAAVKEGRKTLFVAEKMAALEVVKRRLDNIGLGEMCLELHSHKARKRLILEELGRTLELAAPKEPELDPAVARLEDARNRLTLHAERLHTPLEPSGVTPYRVIGELIRLRDAGVPPADFTLAGPDRWTPDQRRDRLRRLEDLATRTAAVANPSRHPWRGVMLDLILPMDLQRTVDGIPPVADRVRESRESAASLADTLGAPPPGSLGEIRALVRYGTLLAEAPPLDRTAIADAAWTDRRADLSDLVKTVKEFSEARARLEGIVVEAGWTADAAAIRRDLAARGRSWFRWLFPSYRRAQAALRGILAGPPPGPLEERLDIVDRLVAGQAAKAGLKADDELGRRAFGSIWRGEKTDPGAISAIEEWERRCREAPLPADFRAVLSRLEDPAEIGRRSNTLAGIADETQSSARSLFERLRFDVGAGLDAPDLETVRLEELRSRLQSWKEDPESLSNWIAYRSRRDGAAAEGMAELADRVQQGTLEPGEILRRFSMAYHEALLRQVVREHPDLARFEGSTHEQLLREFVRLDLERISLARQEVARAHYAGIPKGGSDIGELGIIRREVEKKRRHLPLRRLLKEAGRAVQAIKPVFMMSPMSVAQYLEREAVEFDLLLIDEASQVRPVDALGSVGRARQIVVVGDDRQLPPTRFFHKVLGEEGPGGEEDPAEFQAGDLESILGLCTAQNLPQRMLRWHYRSRHPSLIAVSNREFYENDLYVVPSPLGPDAGVGLVFRHVAGGVFDRGGSATNRIEAQAVAQAVMEHARDFPDLTLGVGAFSVSQRDAILAGVERLRREQKELEPFFSSQHPEPFFVKNLETIQGDERDVILISVGYGRDAEGGLSMHFGPLSNDGGERRLNVLITRARKRCEVFSSITSGDIDLNRATGRGPQVFKVFLAFAEKGVLDSARTTEGGRESPFEDAVAAAVREKGFEIDSQVGLGGFTVGLAVRDPENPSRYLLGIETDGAAYHASRSARDRDRLRPSVLEDNGWSIHRLWCSDWFRRPQEELRNLLAAVEEAKAERTRRDPGAVTRKRTRAIERVEAGETPAGVDEAEFSTAYEEAHFSVPTDLALHELPVRQMADIVSRIVGIEGPVHEDEIARRVADLWGLARTGPRITQAVHAGLERAAESGKLENRKSFYGVAGQTAFPVRNRSDVSSTSLRTPEMLPPDEIRAALLQVVRTHVGVVREQAVPAAARLFGFRTTGSQLREVLTRELEELVRSAALEDRGGMLYG